MSGIFFPGFRFRFSSSRDVLTVESIAIRLLHHLMKLIYWSFSPRLRRARGRSKTRLAGLQRARPMLLCTHVNAGVIRFQQENLRSMTSYTFLILSPCTSLGRRRSICQLSELGVRNVRLTRMSVHKFPTCFSINSANLRRISCSVRSNISVTFTFYIHRPSCVAVFVRRR